MESLDNLKPFEDLEDWTDDIDLFMEAMYNPPHMADALWQQAKLKKEKEKLQLHPETHCKPEKNNPQLDRLGNPISELNRADSSSTPPPQESNHSIFDKRFMEGPEGNVNSIVQTPDE